ncbi:efflux RND transporter periplasmic adaptor subunit [Cronobacter sakazakii]|nr:efflux RND transporter periplasmic adaptor subunit [Cronobacter sakazakii]ELQ6209985.1 efflux RND transporter periplasmic adaptor subunit [Cronobacter sakazakii]ELY6376036.1 efflux RND transporter periplasmic adaptor subunit [Cronobacter sakazakii]ELZ3958535.1 efflux RND transporter periplasmic adaptor subunit [Cronobacter sakazakii]
MSEAFTDYFRHCVQHLFHAARAFSFFALLPVVVLAAILPLLTGCGDNHQTDRPAPPRPVRYLVITASSPAAHADLRTGEIRAHDETTLSFRTDGRLASREVDIGATVHAGQLLATLERATSENQQASAEAERQGAQAAEQVAALNLKRMQKLMPSGAIAQSQLDSARADWQSAVARLKSSEAALRNARESLDWTQLAAPADGVITSVSASAGQVVSAGQSIFTLATSHARDVVLDVSDPPRFSRAMQARWQVASLTEPAITATAVLRDISPQADPQTRTWRVRLMLTDPPDAMALGASVTVALPQTQTPGFTVPACALTRQNGHPTLFIIDAQQRAQPRPVTIAQYTSDSVIIAGGVRPGDKVIVAGVSKLRVGEKVIPGEAM